MKKQTSVLLNILILQLDLQSTVKQHSGKNVKSPDMNVMTDLSPLWLLLLIKYNYLIIYLPTCS